MGVLKQGFVHTVFFWLKEKNNIEHQEKLHAGLLELSKIDLIQTAYVGKVATTNREVIDSSYDFSITFIFDNKELQDAYQTNEDHYKFIENCSKYWEKVQVYDALS